MEQPFTLWPRGVLAGALLAGVLAVPVFVIMGFDCIAAGAPPDSAPSGSLATAARPLRMQAHSAFFAGTLAVRASFEQRPGAGTRSRQTGPKEPSSLLRLRLENRSSGNMAVDIVSVDAPWGSIASEPRRLILAPHQSSTVDAPAPGRQLAGGSLAMAVALQVDGQVETRRLLLSEPILAQAGD